MYREIGERFFRKKKTEKIHEEMITASDSFNTVDLGRYFAILSHAAGNHGHYGENGVKCSPVERGFAYNSGTNPDFLGVRQLRDLIRLHVGAGV
jgi:hypothetical protein